MQDLTIGQAVEVTAVSFLEYDLDDKRIVLTTPCYPFKALIIGKRVKLLGTINHDYEDSGIFCPKGSVMFWECRHGMRNKPMLVADCDLKITDSFDMVEQASKPRYKC